MSTNPQGFRLWKSKARAFLTFKSPSAGRVLDWAERHTEPITAAREAEAVPLAPDLDATRASLVMCTAIQETVSGQLRMTRPQLADEGRGLELWRLLVREHGAPGQPLIQRDYNKIWRLAH